MDLPDGTHIPQDIVEQLDPDIFKTPPLGPIDTPMEIDWERLEDPRRLPLRRRNRNDAPAYYILPDPDFAEALVSEPATQRRRLLPHLMDEETVFSVTDASNVEIVFVPLGDRRGLRRRSAAALRAVDNYIRRNQLVASILPGVTDSLVLHFEPNSVTEQHLNEIRRKLANFDFYDPNAVTEQELAELMNMLPDSSNIEEFDLYSTEIPPSFIAPAA